MALSSTLRSSNSCYIAEFSVECFTYAHSRSRPVPSLTSPVYDLAPTAAIATSRPTNIERPSRLHPQTFPTGAVCSHHTESNALLNQLPDCLLEKTKGMLIMMMQLTVMIITMKIFNILFSGILSLKTNAGISFSPFSRTTTVAALILEMSVRCRLV